MRESILTIPVNEVFEPDEDGNYTGCPFCRMRDTVELHICEYIMGAAMMEPDVRMETNTLGFCHTHFSELLKQNNRLSLGLMLNSYLEKMSGDIFGKKNFFAHLENSPKKTQRVESAVETCFVCSKTEWGMEHMIKTFFVMFRDDEKFKKLFNSQEFICLPHYSWLRKKSGDLKKNEQNRFIDALDGLTGEYIKQLNQDVNDFCNSFDYRNAGKLHSPEMEHVRTSVSRAIYFLTGRTNN
jgi:hypothetical protein